jgi:adenylate kinase family enzyme
MIIGCGGSGKSTLAVRLGESLSLPVHHLDRLYWQPGWEKLPRDEWRALQEELCAQPVWILDGNYTSTMDVRFESADAIILLDLSTLSCLVGVIRRRFRFRGRSRPDMAEGCPEKLDWEFLKWILRYRKDRRPKVLARLRELGESKRVVILPSRRAVRRYLENEAAKSAGSTLGSAADDAAAGSV